MENRCKFWVNKIKSFTYRNWDRIHSSSSQTWKSQLTKVRDLFIIFYLVLSIIKLIFWLRPFLNGIMQGGLSAGIFLRGGLISGFFLEAKSTKNYLKVKQFPPLHPLGKPMGLLISNFYYLYLKSWFFNCMKKAVTSVRLSWDVGLKKNPKLYYSIAIQDMAWITDHSTKQTVLDHLNTELVRHSDCIWMLSVPI